MSAYVDPFLPFINPTPTPQQGGSYIDPATGQEVMGSANVPAGTPFYQSSVLGYDPRTGGSKSSTATATNPLDGVVDSVGGTFGNDAVGAAADAPMNATLNKDLSAPWDYSKVDQGQLNAMGKQWMSAQNGGSSMLDPVTGQMSGTPNPIDAIRSKAIQGQPLTATEQAFMAIEQGNGMSSGDTGTVNQDGTTNAGQVNGGQLSPYRFGADGTVTYDPTLGRIAGVDASGNALTGDYQQQLIQQGLMTQDQADALNANAAEQNAASAAANAPSTADADPFGRFDDPAHPTHGVITPASEAAMGAAADANPSALTTNPDGSPMNAAPSTPMPQTALPIQPISGQPPLAPPQNPTLTPSTPPISGQPPIPPPTVDPTIGGDLGIQPISGQPPVVPPAVDPFAPFVQKPQQPTVTGGGGNPSQLAAY